MLYRCSLGVWFMLNAACGPNSQSKAVASGLNHLNHRVNVALPAALIFALLLITERIRRTVSTVVGLGPQPIPVLMYAEPAAISTAAILLKNLLEQSRIYFSASKIVYPFIFRKYPCFSFNSGAIELLHIISYYDIMCQQ